MKYKQQDLTSGPLFQGKTTAISLVLLGQFAITYVQPLQNIFVTEGTGIQDGLIILLIGIALFTIIELEKQIRIRLSETQQIPKSHFT